MNSHRLCSTILMVILAFAAGGTVVAQPGTAPDNPMELAVALANAKVPAGMVVPDTALSRYRTGFGSASAATLNADLPETVKRLDTPMQLDRRGEVWVMQAPDVPAEIAERLQRPRYLATPIKSTASHAVFNVVAGLLQDREVSGVLGTGLQPDQQCPLQVPVALAAGPTSVLGLLNQTVRQAPGLVWFISYDSERSKMAIGVVCPGGHYTKMILL
jgi:hypothetical protein